MKAFKFRGIGTLLGCGSSIHKFYCIMLDKQSQVLLMLNVYHQLHKVHHKPSYNDVENCLRHVDITRGRRLLAADVSKILLWKSVVHAKSRPFERPI